MEEFEKKGKDQDFEASDSTAHSRQEIFSETVRAGKRTYFFDVKSTRAGEYYLTITESKRRFNNESGKFFYEKHKLFLYKEDFEKFSEGLKTTVDFIQTENASVSPPPTGEVKKDPHTDVDFEDLGNEPSEVTEDTDLKEDNEQ
jgi:hypothetical protein